MARTKLSERRNRIKVLVIELIDLQYKMERMFGRDEGKYTSAGKGVTGSTIGYEVQTKEAEIRSLSK